MMEMITSIVGSPFQVAPPTDPGSARPAADDEGRRSSSAPRHDHRNFVTGEELSVDERREVEELKRRDREVRTHEQAHINRAGPYAAGAPTFTYVTGPDGRRYAVAGEVQLDTSPELTPEATLRKAETIQAAALAPAHPSPQDRAVAAQARRMAQEARTELQAERAKEMQGTPDVERQTGDPRVSAYEQDPSEQAGQLVSILA